MGEPRGFTDRNAVVPYSPTPFEDYYDYYYNMGMPAGGVSGTIPCGGTGGTPRQQSPLPLIAINVSGAHQSFHSVEKGRAPAGIAVEKPLERWLPLTRSRNGSTFYAVLQLVASGIGIQALLLPLAFAALGWALGITCLTIAFAWQLYTIWLLVHLHESPSGARCSRYLRLSITAFGEKYGKLLTLFPVLYLSGGTCVQLTIAGGGIMKRFFVAVCGGGGGVGGSSHCDTQRLSGAEWFLVFVVIAILLNQLLPHLNSVAAVSLLAAIAGIGYCTIIWAVSVNEGKPSPPPPPPSMERSQIGRLRDILNGLGIIALSFRGHNVIPEIQGTLPWNPKRPTCEPMWRAVIISYVLIAMCLYPLAIVGYWANGDQIPVSGIPTSASMMDIFTTSYGHNISKSLMSFTLLLIVINSFTSFQIYAMVILDNWEFLYCTRKNRPCPWWLRRLLRLLFGSIVFLLAVAFPFLANLSPLIGGLTSTVTFAYPCFMWNAIKKPSRRGFLWFMNLGMGCLGILLCVVLVAAAIWNIVAKGIHANFFNPH